jgi:phosphoglycolate phosphatase-like HAD superfamily hydrolase
MNELRSTGLDALFSFVRVGVGLREYGIVVNKALEVLSAEAQETVVSDWCKDIEYAKFSGLTAIGIVGGVSEADEHRNAGADWVIEYLSEIPRVL